MAIVMGFDIHREQITYDWLDDETGELRRGRIAPADRLGVRRFLRSLPVGSVVDVALEATTGWRFIVEEIVQAGMTAHLAEPAETATLRGRKARAKTDRADARLMLPIGITGRGASGAPKSGIKSPPGASDRCSASHAARRRGLPAASAQRPERPPGTDRLPFPYAPRVHLHDL